MPSRLPHWIGFGSAILAFVAGHCNAVGLLGFENQAVSHVTGIVSQLGISLFAEPERSVNLLCVFGSFFLGAVVSGIIIQDATLRLGRRYGVALLVESALLAVAVVLLSCRSSFGIWCVACACGLQNAMVSTFSGAILRTTHLTGTVTDLGILVGHKIRRLPVDGNRVRLALRLLIGFAAGTVSGATAYFWIGDLALLVPMLLTGLAGIAFSVYQHRSPEEAGEE